MNRKNNHLLYSEPHPGENLSVEWGELKEEDDEEVDYELDDLCKGPFCESTTTDKL
jgi:hypothetical protein